MDVLKILSSEPAFWSRIGFADDPTRFDENGKIKFYSEDWSTYIAEHQNFYNQGIKLHTSILHNGWVGVDKYDYSAVDRTLEAICSIAPDLLYMPRIKFNVPIEWYYENPTEVYLTYDAPRDAEGIKAVIKKLEPYYNTSGLCSADLPSENGLAGMQSFSSDKWLEDSVVAMKKLIEHIENSKYANQIIAYQVGYGMCAENAHWGGWNTKERWGDYGITACKKFEEYCVKKYGSIEAVLKKYKITEYTDPKQLLPTPEMRFHTPENLEDFFRCNNERTIDYAMFLSKSNTNAVRFLARELKRFTDGKPVGTFYGYIHTETPAETAHLGIQDLLDCDEIDFIASPKAYYRCDVASSGGTQATSMSSGFKKIWFDELDNCSHVGVPTHNPANCPKTFEESRLVYWREVAKNLAWGNLNFWWMDLNGDWFMDDELMNEIGRIYEFNKEMRKKDRKSISEILLVNDEKSINYCNSDGKLHGGQWNGVLNEMTVELLMCGAPVDEYRLSDLKDIDLSQYKMIVFANTYCVDDETRKIIKNISKETLCIFNYAAGIRNPEFSLDNVRELTSFEIEVQNGDFSLSDGYMCDVMLPPVKIKDNENLEVIDRYPDGAIKTAKSENKILCTTPYFRSKDFNFYAKKANCHMYSPAGITVYADSRFLGIFGSVEGEVEFTLKDEDLYTNLITGEEYTNKTNRVNGKNCALLLVRK